MPRLMSADGHLEAPPERWSHRVPEKCTGCGECLDYCPAPGALVQLAA